MLWINKEEKRINGIINLGLVKILICLSFFLDCTKFIKLTLQRTVKMWWCYKSICTFLLDSPFRSDGWWGGVMMLTV